MVVVSGFVRPASVSSEIWSDAPAARFGHRNSTCVREAPSTGTYSPFTFTRAPPSSVDWPVGSFQEESSGVSHFPSRLAIAPGLQASSDACVAPFTIAVTTGLPPSTST